MNCTVWVSDPIEWCHLWSSFCHLCVILSKGGTWNFSWVPGNFKTKESGALHEARTMHLPASPRGDQGSRRTQTEFGRRAVRTIDFGFLWLVPPCQRSPVAKAGVPRTARASHAGECVGKPGPGPRSQHSPIGPQPENSGLHSNYDYDQYWTQYELPCAPSE